jgi:transcriptional regulator with XRE-family HTH domain
MSSSRVLEPGERLRDARKARGLTVVELGRLVGASPSTISDWERSKYKPKAEALDRLAAVLGVPARELLTGIHYRTAGERAASRAPNSSVSPQAGFTITGERAQRQWTQQHLADLAGLDVTTLSRIENGERRPTPRQRVALENVLDLTLRQPANPEWDAYLLSHSVPDRWPEGLLILMCSAGADELKITALDALLVAAASEHPEYFKPSEGAEWVALLAALRRDFAWVKFRVTPDLPKAALEDHDRINEEAGPNAVGTEEE